MITIQELNWGNWFSYGEPNRIILDSGKVTQIIGTNGSGKSSIPVIMGEILYGKNALGKTKSKLSNRYLNKTTLGTIKFTKDGDEYLIDYKRKSTLKLLLNKNGIDISSHTTSDTYKTLADILGYDFKTFWGLIYQSSKEGLEFLTATDTNRKKFMINIFNLDVYLHIHELFKTISTQKNTEIQVIKGKLSTIQAWIEKNEAIDLTKKPLNPIPEISKKDIDEITNLKVELGNIREDNKKINDNNTLKQILENLDTSILNQQIYVPSNLDDLIQKGNEIQRDIATCNANIAIYKNNIDKISWLEGKCPTCAQPIEDAFKQQLLAYNKDLIDTYEKQIKRHNKEINVINVNKNEVISLMNKKAQQEQVQKELSTLLTQIDKTLPSEIKQEEDLQNKINELSSKISSLQAEIGHISKLNLEIEAHNSKVTVIKGQLKEYKEQLSELEATSAELDNASTKINIIKKAFSTNGLLSYKLEHLSKDLEDQINIYLAELSKGRFQLNFTIVGEKLNVEIIDDGSSITIEELSAGELARVNTATLLALRKLMAAISSAKINILFLDEIMGTLDDEGKEVLIDILLNEKELNTFLVSHEYTNPLIPQINIIKENKISRIEE